MIRGVADFHTLQTLINLLKHASKLVKNKGLSNNQAWLAQPLPVEVIGSQVHGRNGRSSIKEEQTMLWTIFIILLILWLVGIVSSYTMGGFIHLLLVIALVVLLINLISGRRPVV